MKYYIDLGSNKIKIYENKKDIPTLIEEKTIIFKEYFSEEIGISTKNYRELMIYTKQLVEKYNLNKENCNIYAIGIWRKISKEQYEMLRADFNEVGLKFNILSSEEENFYFEKTIQEIYDRKKILMINIRGVKSELIVFDKGNITKKINLNVGISEILNNFPEINDERNNLKIDDILNYVLEIIKDEKIDFKCDCGIFIGRELKFQEQVKYNLIPNKIFNDGIHEYMISYEELEKKNKELLETITLADLYLLMQNDKKLINGAKTVAILAQAIFKKANIKYIIPSDFNIINEI